MTLGAGMRLTHGQAVATMVACAFMWSIAGVVTRHLDSARSFEVTFWRSFFTVLSLVIILPLLRGRQAFAQLARSGGAFWLSAACWGVMFTAYMVALTMASVANVLVTLAAGPLFTAVVARVALGDPLPRRTWLAVLVAGAGIAWIYGGQLGSGELPGMLVALCVPVAAAINWTVVQRSQAHGRDVDLVAAVLAGAVISSLATLPLALPLQATAHDIGLLALLGLVQLAIPCTLAVVCAKVLKAPEVALLALLEVIFGIALAWAGAGEAPSSAALVGGILVLGALAANELAGWRNRARVLQTR